MLTLCDVAKVAALQVKMAKENGYLSLERNCFMFFIISQSGKDSFRRKNAHRRELVVRQSLLMETGNEKACGQDRYLARLDKRQITGFNTTTGSKPLVVAQEEPPPPSCALKTSCQPSKTKWMEGSPYENDLVIVIFEPHLSLARRTSRCSARIFIKMHQTKFEESTLSARRTKSLNIKP